MHHPMLPRDDDTQFMTFEGKTVILLTSKSGTYREWDVRIDRKEYCIVDEDGTWTLLVCGPDKSWQDTDQDVDTFLTTHKLILAA